MTDHRINLTLYAPAADHGRRSDQVIDALVAHDQASKLAEMEVMTTGEALRRATAALRDGGIDGAARDAADPAGACLGIAPDRVGLCLDEGFSPEQVAGLNTRVAARLARQPVSQIVGHRLFWGRRFRVTRSVLDPRPETETLVAAALEEAFKRFWTLGQARAPSC